MASHLLNPAPLDPLAQEILLADVERRFRDTDKEKLNAHLSKSEDKLVLKTSRPHAAPGTNGLTVYFYNKSWSIICDSLTEVIQSVFNGSICQLVNAHL